jgi:hypothetical protein
MGGTALLAQTEQAEKKKAPPALLMTRAEESYRYLRDSTRGAYQPGFADPLKFIPLNQAQSVYVTLGGEYRARLEHFTHRNWTSADDTYYSQRASLHANVQLGARLRVFGELYHGMTTLTEANRRILEDDLIALHQGFVEFIPLKHAHRSLSIRLGRGEMGFGASRLMDIREGPNLRRSYDAARVIYRYQKVAMNLFYGREVNVQFEAFDNRSGILDRSPMGGPTLWGLYTQGPSPVKGGTYDVYYVGFHSERSAFNDVVGEETRHALGIRSSGTVGKRFSYNTELIYQFGSLGESQISAFNLETDWTYLLVTGGWKPTLGLKLDFSSGDQAAGDGKVQTFNPMFVNPAIYSLAAVNTPANLASIHPNFTVYPLPRMSINVDYARFYRSALHDGLYAPPRFLVRPANGLTERLLGDVFGLQLFYLINRNITFSLRSSYFLAGPFIEASGPSEHTWYVSPTLSLRF